MRIGKLRITGWAGQHDEAGASIRNEDDTIHFNTPNLGAFGGNWTEYQNFPEELIKRWNKGETSWREIN